MRLSLPSEVHRPPDDDWQVLTSPGPEHTARSAESMSALAIAASTHSPTTEPLEVIISHVDHQGFLSPRLYLFHLQELDADGAPVDAIGDVRRAHVVSVLNQPVARQVESMVSMLSQIAARHRRRGELMARQSDGGQIDLELAQIDEEASDDVADVLRHGWRAAAEMVARNAAEIGLPLRVTYQPDPLPGLAEVAPRIPALKRAYNELPEARDAIDRVVGRTATGGVIASDMNTPEQMRGFLQQHFQLSGSTQYFAQALRDAFALGNGYVAFTEAEPLGAYNLPPESTAVGPSAGTARLSEGAAPMPVAHFKGIEQPSSPFGMSLLEAVLPLLFQVDVFGEALEFARRLIAEEHAEGREWAERTVTQGDRVLAACSQRVKELLGPMLLMPPPPPSGIYFVGSELL